MKNIATSKKHVNKNVFTANSILKRNASILYIKIEDGMIIHQCNGI